MMSSMRWHAVHGVLCLDQEVGHSDVVVIDPLTEDTLIENLHQRFKRDQIYTYIGTMVIAINPYKKLAFYSPEVIAAYQHHNMLDLPPHIYAIAEHVFQSMKDRNQDQCIITTGESGSGKTESGKIALQYLILGASPRRNLECLKEQLLSVSNVLEAFGNAMTIHNNNSSRFGMFLEVEFDFKGDPMGGTVTNYLLEKSRVVQFSSGERNFHIFYQILTGADLHLLKCLKLQRNADNYCILSSQSSKVDEIDDKINFVLTKRAMETIGFNDEEMLSTFQIISCVLKLSNLQFIPRANIDGTEGCSILNEYEIYDVCELLLTDMPALEAAFTQRIIETRHEFLVADLCSVEAKRTRDALCKALYSRLFTWIVTKLNECIKAKTLSKRKSVGILDIYGFEVFENNFFEQFLINYCNEKLHQIFTDMTLRYEQEEYIKEGIQWRKIDFFNNSVICELIERNNHGILSMLDEECLRPNPVNDEVFLQNMAKVCQDNPYFESLHNQYFESHGCKSFVDFVPQLNVSSESHNPSSSTLPQQCFRLRHFAGTVTYSVSGFVEKNNDLLYRDLSYVMYQSQHPLLKILFPEGNPYRTQMKRPASISTQFKISISALMKNIQSKQLNFVKCIKPNQLKEPHNFELGLVQHQVRYLLLVETCKLRKAGYFYREDYEIFLRRYKLLSPLTWPEWRGPAIEGVTILLKDLPIHPSEYAFGKSKIFFKNLKMVTELDDFRTERLNELASLVQKTWRGWSQRKLFIQLLYSQRIISRNYRCWKRRGYLLWLSRRLPSQSPLSREWPLAPRSLQQTNHLLRKLYHKWRCNKYRYRFDQTARNRMREKVTASLIFRDRKTSYKKSVSHPFRGDYIRLRQSVRWKRSSSELGDQYVVFADIVNKITKSSGKFVQKLLVISTSVMIIMDQRTMQVKYRIPVNDISRISLSPYMDDIVIIHVCCEENPSQKRVFILESGHIIEIVTKLFLVIQNALGKPPEVQISNEFEAHFGKEIVTLIFRCSGPPDTSLGPVKIHRRGNRMEFLL